MIDIQRAGQLNERFIANQLFGMEVDWDAFIDRSLAGMRKQPNYLHAKQLLIELYETQYGIYDHTTSTSPLSGVLFNDAEKYLDNYLFDNYFNTFLYKEIYARTGLSFDEFLDKPRYEIEKIFRLVDDYNKKKSAVASSVTNDLESAAAGLRN